jgi:hypothetical protein
MKPEIGTGLSGYDDERKRMLARFNLSRLKYLVWQCPETTDAELIEFANLRSETVRAGASAKNSGRGVASEAES